MLPSRRTPPPAAPSLPACVARTVASTTVPADYLSPPRRMALTLSEPRRGRADGIPGSEWHATACHASAGQGSVTRRPGEGERRSHSAELRSMRDQPPAPAQAAHLALRPLYYTRRCVAPGGGRNATVIWMRISVEIDLCYGYRGDACRCGCEQQRVE